MIKRCLTSLVATLIVCFLACSSASARVCFLPDSTDCGEGDVVGSGNVDVPCQYSSCPAYNSNYQECYDERTYNNAGVNVTCKQIRCKLSKSKCEELEADANNSQCCNFDSASGCYYMGKCPILCNRNIYDRTTDLSGEDYTCTSCKDKNGTFYNCTAKEKECNQINSNYTSSCGDSQIAKEVEGIKDSHGNQCYTCVDKPAGCTYEYRQATTADSCGLRDFENTTKCMSSINGCHCYTQLHKVSSVYASAGTVVPYNRISNKSATCVDDKGVTRYQTICQGTPKSICSAYGKNYELKPNGCVSDTYNNGFEVKGDEWGDCVKKEETCTYEYTRIDDSNGHGDSTFSSSLYRDFQNHVQNTRGAGIYWNGLGDFDENHDYSGFQMYSRIDKNSKSCQKINGVTAYETICPGTARVACKKKFVPNGCSSEQYAVYRLTVESMDFGDCSCDTSNGLYDTVEECEKANEGASLKCTLFTSRWCYQTCESAGMYSTEDACKTNAPKYTKCNFDGRCYKRDKKGWGIHYTHRVEEWNNRKYNCTKQKHENGKSDLLWTSWDVSVINTNNPGAAKDLDGNTYWSINEYKGEVRYPAGEYRICFNYAYGGTTHYIYPNSIHLAKRNGDACDYRWNTKNDEQWHPDKNNKKFCSNVSPNTISGSYSACMIATFEDYEEYYVEGSFNSVSGSGYSCKRAGSSPY